MMKIVLTGTTGKIGGAVLNAIVDYSLTPLTDLVIATSSQSDDSRLAYAVSQGVTVRQANYDSIQSMTQAFEGCDRLFLVSSPHIDLDFHNCAKGGREQQHFNAFQAAKGVGIKHVYYTSLAFQAPSKAAVMRAHLRTEEYLRSQSDFDFTIIREGIYSESWPLYLGHYNVPHDDRERIVIGHDGPISWTSIADLGLATAMIITGRSEDWTGTTQYLSAQESLTITDVALLVGKARGKPLFADDKSQQEYIDHYVDQRSMNNGLVQWWSSTYLALRDSECRISDTILERLLAEKHRKPVAMDKTIESMYVKFRQMTEP